MFANLLTTVAKLLGAGGAKAIVADRLLMKQQLLIINRSRRRAPNLTPVDLSLIHISEPTRLLVQSRMPSSA